MNVIEKTRNDIKAYVKSLNTPENTVYQENALLILSCFAKAQEILEENEKLALIIPDVVQQSELYTCECKVCGKPFGDELSLYEHYDEEHN